MISFNKVSKVFPNRQVALQQVSFEINKGEFVFLVGPSGAGKTTILELITCEEKPTTGMVSVAGRVVNRLKPSQVPYLRRNLGIVFQDFRLLPQKTVYENVAFAMQVVEAPPSLIRRRVPLLLELVGLHRKANDLPQQLSGGEQQRTGLARALANDPLLLLCDEPTGNLDPETAWEIMNLLVQINNSGATILMATHAKNLVDRMKRRVIAIDAGHIVRDDYRGGYS
ncbi:MAG: cell division ATP-binding protein FtsE [Symbiobacteriaceae bacterium]|nr:cell division ATP-binding protein FtsE [Symbiobacteriaceae bacterium]